MDEIKEMLNEEIKAEMNGLYDLDPGSEEKSAAIDDLVKLYRLRIDEAKSENDLSEKRAQFKLENDSKQLDRILKEKLETENGKRGERLGKMQIEEQSKDRIFRASIAAAEIVLPLIFYAAWMRKGFKFEETGTFTSTTFRGLFGKFKPTKK